MNAPEQDGEPWAVFERSSPGWFRVTLRSKSAGGNDVQFFVGGVIDDDDRPAISGVALLGQGLTSASLRNLPLGRIQAALNEPRHREWIRSASSVLHPFRELQDVADESPHYVFRQDGRRPPLTRPDGTDPPSFYRQVAQAYRHYIKHSSRPAVDIATEAGVPVSTARRWINHARELGLLEKGQRGRAI